MKTLEQVFNKKDPFWTEKNAAVCEWHTDEGVYHQKKDIMQVGFLEDLKKIADNFEICNLHNPKQTVRKIKINEEVCIDVMDGSIPLCFPMKTPVYYEPWFMDRGSYLIWVDKIGDFGKFATENDIIKIKCEE